MTGKDHTAPRAASLLLSVLAYAGIASVGTGVMLSGVFFITRETFQFTDLQNLLLGLCVQAPYIPAALLAGPICKRLGARRLLIITILGMTLVCGVLAMMPSVWTWWLLVPCYNAFSGMQWPIVESYIASGRHGRDMRRAIGLFNITWAATIAPGLWLVSLMHGMPQVTFIVLAVIHGGTLALVARWPTQPATHDAEIGRSHTGEAYPNLLRASRVLLPMGYVLIYMLAPLLPGIWDRLHVDPQLAPTLTSTWIMVRVGVFFLMFWFPLWHGKWAILGVGATLLITGTVLVLLESAVWVAILGLALMGFGQGMIYYAALYYGMAVEHAAVDSGGRHEAIIGLGYILGPSMGLLGGALPIGGPTVTAGVMLMTCAVSVVGSSMATRFYFKARRRRIETAELARMQSD